MRLQELIQQYDFHDSLIENVAYDKAQAVLSIHLDFCAWMQPGYQEENPETMPAVLYFTGVTAFSGPTGNMDDYSILTVSSTDSTLVFQILDDFHNKDYEIRLKAENVQFMPEP